MKITLFPLLALSFLTDPTAARAHEAHAQEAAGPVTFKVQKLADGVYAAVAPAPKPPAVSNSAFIVLSDEVLVVDSHMTQEASKALLAEIQKVTDKPVRYLVHTHFHGDHVGGNPAFPGAVDILAHAKTREHLQAENPTGAVLPNATVQDGITFYRGKEVQVRYSGRGHTDGDIYVWLPAEKILISGDLFVSGYIGFLKDGYLQEWIQTLSTLVGLRAAMVVPGHGPVSDTQAVELFQTYLRDFQAEVKKLKDQGLDKETAIAKFRMPAPYKKWGMQEMALKDNIGRAYDQLP